MIHIDYKSLSPTRIIALSFVAMVLVGGLLLSLPISSASGEYTDLLTSWFTAASATCVTGLVVADTFTHWSIFGQVVILALIQVGGLGFITILTMFSLIMGKKIGLRERTLIMESAGAMHIGGVVLLIRRVLIGTFTVEAIGAVLLSLRFCPTMGLFTGIYYGIFHSVSAFCNAGFDLMGKYQQFSSVTAYTRDPVVCITIMALIVIGGIGFLVWDDIATNKGNIDSYRLHSKLVLATTGVLIVGGTLLMLFLERNHTMAEMGGGEALLASAFAAVSPRTAGFNSVPLGEMSEGGLLLTMLLMVVGGSPGSTAGGMKTTTFIVLMLAALSSSRQINGLNIFKRRVEDSAIRRAGSVAFIYLSTAMIGAFIICAIEPFSMRDIMFEVLSAIGTVGLSLGITTKLSWISKIIIILLMIGGRVGSLTVALALTERKLMVPVNRPIEKIVVG